MFRVTILLTILLLCGCSTQLPLVVNSSPPGATITEQNTGNVMGLAPVQITYEKSVLENHHDENSGCYKVTGFNAIWASGATSTSPAEVLLCQGLDKQYTLNLARPENHPGVDKDMQFALQMQSLQLQQQQALAAERAQALQYLLYGQMQRNKKASQPIYTDCVSKPGYRPNTVETTCY